MDLFENSHFGQMLQAESIKFTFVKDQVLTTFAYEVSLTYRHKIKRYHFIHVAQPNKDGVIEYFGPPLMVHFNEQDPLKVIALKIFKHIRPLLI